MKYREAYHLMNYACNCGHKERIWNSRDGVTPFTVPCPKCLDQMGLCHVNWHEDIFDPCYLPEPGERYFANMSLSQAREYASKNVDRAIKHGSIDRNTRNGAIKRLTHDYYDDGHSPILLVKPYPHSLLLSEEECNQSYQSGGFKALQIALIEKIRKTPAYFLTSDNCIVSTDTKRKDIQELFTLPSKEELEK